MTDDNSLFYRMLHSPTFTKPPIAMAAEEIAKLQAAREKPEKLNLTDGDKKFLHDLRIKA